MLWIITRQALPIQVIMPWIVAVWKIFECSRRFEAMKGRGFVLGLDGSREVIIDTKKRVEANKRRRPASEL